MSIADYIATMSQAARAASAEARRATTEEKNRALHAIGDEILSARDDLMLANEKDLDAGRKSGISEPLLDRLAFTQKTFDSMVDGLEQVARLPDPIGEISDLSYRPNGLQVGRMRTPIGVIGIIYESRPNVTIDAASLCLKSGNATILRGGSESIFSNRALAACIQRALGKVSMNPDVIQLIETTDRDAVGELLKQDAYVDVIVPRGGRSLIERISSESRIPVIKHLDGICHVYVDGDADQGKAMDIVINAKTQRYAVCNSMETLLVAHQIAQDFLPAVAAALHKKGVELRGCQRTLGALQGSCPASLATEDDWYEEYLGPILAIKVVDSLDEAITHINHYGSNHTDTIVSENYSRSRRFLQEVDSSSVIVNASTRFADGFEFGLGAEIGISTDKLHARGPVGLEGLTSQKFIVLGDGQIRQ